MTFDKFLVELPSGKILDVKGKFVPIDLSVANTDATSRKTSAEFEQYIHEYLNDSEAAVAYGGYNEKRNLYERSELFNDSETEERNIHLGLDLWTPAGTTVLTPIDGTIHSFDFNAGLGNYGPTIILSHNIANHTFYTLYGHLSMESLEEIEIGDVYAMGEPLAVLGDASENGDYAPHLHFQIIREIDGYFGDFPGVCSVTDLKPYLKICPDPNLLLKLNRST